MAIDGISSYYSKMRLTGLGGSGLDTDTVVSQMMKIERMKVDKLDQKKQFAQWRQEAYRDITSTLSGFKSEFLDYLKPTTNMLSKSSYKKFSSTVDGGASVSVTGGSDASVGTHKVMVNQLATADTAESAVSLKGTSAPAIPLDVSGKGFQISVDGGAAKTISFAPGTVYNTMEELALGVQNLIDAQIGAGKAGVSYDAANQLVFSTAGVSKSIQLLAGTDGVGTNDMLTLVGITPGSANYSGVSKALKGTGAITAGDIALINGGSPKKINIDVDGITREITLGTTYGSAADIVTDLNNKISSAFGTGKVTVSETAPGSGILNFAPGSSGVSKITMYSGTTSDGLQKLHFDSGASNRLRTSMTLARLASQFSTPLTFGGGTSTITSTGALDNAYVAGKTWNGKEFNINVDGVVNNIAFSTNPTTVNGAGGLVETLQGLIDAKVGAGKVTVGLSGSNELTFTRGAGVGYITFNSGAATLDALSQLKVSSGASAAGELKFTINGNNGNQGFTFKASDTLNEMMSVINSDNTAKVHMSYDEVSDKFKLTATQLGAGDNIRITEGAGNFFSGVSGINALNPVTVQGTDSNVTIDGQTLMRSSNSVTANGVTYNLLSKSTSPQTVSLNVDVDTIYNNITGFVKKYNEVIDKLNGKLSEEYKRDYQPLTQEQKESMKEEDVKKWEEKAKTGLLRNDQIIQNVLTKMRRALYDKVGNDSAQLTDIGITTDSYYTKGKLIIDEEKLKNAIKNNPDKVMNLFSKPSESHPTYSRLLTADERLKRYSEEGIAHRLADILNDNISTSRDSNGRKGILIEKAGIIGDTSEFKSTLYSEINQYDTRIKDMNKTLNQKEDRYYQKFAALEKMMAKMNSQSGWLSSQLGAG